MKDPRCIEKVHRGFFFFVRRTIRTTVTRTVTFYFFWKHTCHADNRQKILRTKAELFIYYV